MKNFLYGEKFEYHDKKRGAYVSDNNVFLFLVKTTKYKRELLKDIHQINEERGGCYYFNEICEFCCKLHNSVIKGTSLCQFCLDRLLKNKDNQIITTIRVRFDNVLIEIPVYVDNIDRFSAYDGENIYRFNIAQGYNNWPDRCDSLYDELSRPIIPYEYQMSDICDSLLPTDKYYLFDNMKLDSDNYMRYTKLRRNLIYKRFLMREVLVGDIANVLIRMIIDFLNYGY